MLGSGIINGLIVTAKNFVGSYHDPKRMVTVEYPEQKTVLPENYRNFPFLITENATDPMGTLRCVACQICEKECPPQCIIIEKSKDKKPDANGKMQIYPAIFGIDTSVCMSCQICVEVCPFDAIKMDKVFEIAATNRFEGLFLTREQLAKPNSYYHEIHPMEAAEVDERLTAERKASEEKAKATAAAKAAAAAAPKPAAPTIVAGGTVPGPTIVARGADPGPTTVVGGSLPGDRPGQILGLQPANNGAAPGLSPASAATPGPGSAPPAAKTPTPEAKP